MENEIRTVTIALSCMAYGCLVGYLLSQLFGIMSNLLIVIFAIIGYFVATKL